MKKYVYITILILFIGSVLIESLGLLDNLERVEANEKEFEQVKHMEIVKSINIIPQTKEFEQVVIFNDPQPFYIKEDSLIKIGQLEPNVEFTIVQEKENFYELLFGHVTVYVEKIGTVFQKKSLKSMINTEVSGAIKTTAQTMVYEAPNNKSPQLLQLDVGFRYPIVGQVDDWFLIKVGERSGYIHKQTVQLDEGIPVLVYHHILPKALMKKTTSTISAESFEQQMDYLAAHQFKTIGSHEMYEYKEGRKILPINTVLITFDDGLLSTKEYAYPLLKKHQFRAIQHIISSRTHRTEGIQTFDSEGKLQFFTEEEMAIMSDVFIYEAHTFDLHILNEETKVGKLMEVSAEELEVDLRKNLEEIPNAISLAYPFGHYKEETIEVMKDLGFLLGFTTKTGYANMEDPNYEIKRFGVTEVVMMEEFINYVQGEMLFPE
ncbi:polysaccharide deacetylase family protein [Solibacillus sp. FSL H8-0538]|uniref:polysaccharide deacetylase family protein n=1 Tax=Solibacillus sp. FSL H8-0538 TaxID=2921400 RepID=UPI0030F8897C